MELPDREHLGGWAAILAELDRDKTRVDKNVKIETFASVKEEEPVSPVDGAGLAGTCDEGGRWGGWGEANSATLKANLGTSVPVTGCGIASGKRTSERALDEIYRVDWVGRVEERGRKEGNSMLDGLGENRRHGEWEWGGWISPTVGVVVRTRLIRMVALRINGKSELYVFSQFSVFSVLREQWRRGRVDGAMGRWGDGWGQWRRGKKLTA